jgi:ApbE superfamily uncharacterized protein (UPF0280 family)
MPVSVCSSSGKFGHSLSKGLADVICLLSPSAVLADGAATSLGNKITSKTDLDEVPEWAKGIEDILGGIVILDDKMATWGDIEMVGL